MIDELNIILSETGADKVEINLGLGGMIININGETATLDCDDALELVKYINIFFGN